MMLTRVYTAFFDDLEQRITQGQDPKCFARGMADLGSKYGFDDAQIYFAGKEMQNQNPSALGHYTNRKAAGSIIEAGSDTTRNQINLMLAAAARFPAWVTTAQSQLDKVCGEASRLPSFDVG